MATDKQIAANGKNAQKSTGPKTPEGKAIVRLNAVTHGLLARDIFVDTGDGREDPEEYETFLNELRDDLQPHGRLELVLVEKIAVAYWRLRRAARAEAGELRAQLDVVDDGEQGRQDAAMESVRQDLVSLKKRVTGFDSPLWVEDGGPTPSEKQQMHREKLVRKLRKSPLGVQHFIETLNDAIDEVTKTHGLVEDTLERLEREFAREGTSLCDRLYAVASFESDDEDEDEEMFAGRSVYPLSPDEQKAVLRILRAERKSLTQLLVSLEVSRAESRDAARATITLPTDEAVQRIQRYETMYERQLYQAMNQLERLQRRRTGDVTLPPISVTLDRLG